MPISRAWHCPLRLRRVPRLLRAGGQPTISVGSEPTTGSQALVADRPSRRDREGWSRRTSSIENRPSTCATMPFVWQPRSPVSAAVETPFPSAASPASTLKIACLHNADDRGGCQIKRFPCEEWGYRRFWQLSSILIVPALRPLAPGNALGPRFPGIRPPPGLRRAGRRGDAVVAYGSDVSRDPYGVPADLHGEIDATTQIGGGLRCSRLEHLECPAPRA